MRAEDETFSLREATRPLVLIAVWLTFALASPQFLGPRNLSMLMIEIAVTATLSLGMLLVILPGQIDLSAGAGLGMIGGLASVLIFEAGWPAFAAMTAGIIVAALLWTAMGLVIVRWRIPAFIVTLGGMLIFRGTFWTVIHSSTVPVVRGGESNLLSILTTWYLPPSAGYGLAALTVAAVACVQIRRSSLDETQSSGSGGESGYLKTLVAGQAAFLAVLVCNQYRGLPLAFVVLAVVAVAVHVLTRHTPYGRYLYAIGGNEQAAVLSGINSARVVVTAFLLMGTIVALTGYLQTSYVGASTTSVGELMELDAIAACVIGGASLRGGRGTVLGALFGSLLMASLLNGMTLLAVAPELKLVVRGAVLVLAVWLEETFRRE